jgi:hypothetical protein
MIASEQMPRQPNFAQIMEAQRELLGSAPRSFGFLQRLHWRVKPPWWCDEHAPKLLAIYEQQQFLREEGEIVWGVCVQANVLLSQSGRDNCPGAVLYSCQSSWSDELVPLLALAEQLFELKDWTRYADEERAFGRVLANERPSVMHRKVPQSLASGRRVILTTVMFHRKHLPGRRMTHRFFPLLVHADVKATLMVPSRYWPVDLLAEWNE